MTTTCQKCGAEVKYIPMGVSMGSVGVAIVDPEYTEMINDGGRIIKGHLRHRCPETENGPLKKEGKPE